MGGMHVARVVWLCVAYAVSLKGIIAWSLIFSVTTLAPKVYNFKHHHLHHEAPHVNYCGTK